MDLIVDELVCCTNSFWHFLILQMLPILTASRAQICPFRSEQLVPLHVVVILLLWLCQLPNVFCS